MFTPVNMRGVSKMAGTEFPDANDLEPSNSSQSAYLKTQRIISLKGRAMKVPGKPRRVQLDFVRGVAILMVMATHFHEPQTGVRILDEFTYLVALFGSHGVDLFFVLSGYLVGGLLVKEYRDTGKIQAGRFLLRRIFKIWPPFYFLICFHLLARHHPARTFFWQNFLHLQNYLGSSLRQTWTLSIEEHFYLLLAFLFALAASRHLKAATILKLCATLGLLAFVARSITAALGNYQGASRWTQNRMDSLLFGVILALLYYFFPGVYARLTARASPLLAIIGLSILGILYVDDPLLFLGPGLAVIYLAAGAFLLLVNQHSGRLTGWWIYRAIAWIGVYSYALYLWHSVMLGVGDKVIARFPALIAWVLAPLIQFVGALAIAFLATHLVEWPFLRWRESIPWLRDPKPLST
jgi:peptidoglycan/LPS O-acetylase OafA/YrhL